MGAYESGKYRNLFKEIGKTDAEIQQKIEDAVKTFFYDEEERIYHEAGDDMGYLTDTGNNDARTEGMSYGMMMCVQLDMKEEFDRILKAAEKIKSDYYYLSNGYYRSLPARFPKEWFGPGRNVKVLGRTVPVPPGAEKWLKLMYGNYENYPCIWERRPMHLYDEKEDWS